MTNPFTTSNSEPVSAGEATSDAPGRLLAIDPGTRRVGLAISDELRISVKPLPVITRGSWKNLLSEVARIVRDYDVRGLVIGLPLRLEGSEGEAAANSRALAEKFRRSLAIPVFLQDERLTTFAASAGLKAAGKHGQRPLSQVDSEAAAVILRDFINQKRT